MSGQIEITKSRTADVAGTPVRRALPLRTRRTVGAWCFADHMGPLAVTEDAGMEVGPHPHMGLQTVTWLVSGELLHRDSLGSEQLIRPGQLNLMTAGRGVSHAEESTRRYRGEMQGIQLWVAQPEATRHGEAAFEHHTDLPRLDIDDAIATVLVGELVGIAAGASSARRDTDHVGVDVQLRPGRTVLPLVADHEYAIVALEGAVDVSAQQSGSRTRVVPGELAYLGSGGEELELSAGEETRLLLLGGEPFESPILMWWNFVGRTHEEMTAAAADWNEPTAAGARFGDPGSALARIPAPTTPWS
jgi:quercetin 2,3-dioxygenase